MFCLQGLKLRIFLVEKFFGDVTLANAQNPREPPMGYHEQKELLKVLLDNGVNSG